MLNPDCLTRPLTTNQLNAIEQRKAEFHTPGSLTFIDSCTAMWDVKFATQEAIEAYVQGSLTIQEGETPTVYPQSFSEVVTVTYMGHYYEGLDL